MEPFDQEITRALSDETPEHGPAIALLVCHEDDTGDAMQTMLSNALHDCHRARSLNEARDAIKATRYDVVLLRDEMPDGDALGLLPDIGASRGTGAIVLSHQRSFQTVCRAMRSGARDFITLPVVEEDLLGAVESALASARRDQQNEARLIKLKRICHELNTVRRDISQQVDVMCEDLAGAFADMNTQMTDMALATEFRTLVRQELDVEELLRTVLEYLLTKTGPTNAAVFLPDSQRTFGLGAYVNYDCPRDTIATLLDHLCDAVCPQMRRETQLVRFDDAEQFSNWIGLEAGLLDHTQVIAFSCHHHDDCLAVVVLFRDRDEPFDESLAPTIETLRGIFAEQLANLIRVHHRAGEIWPAQDDGDDEDHGFGYEGGLAA